MDIPYEDDLLNIREILETFFPYFPKSRCQDATRVVHQILGLDEVAGEYTPTGRWHAMNKDEKLGIYVGITEDMFDHTFPKITYFKIGDERFKEMPEHLKEHKRIMGKEWNKDRVKQVIDLYKEKHQGC